MPHVLSGIIRHSLEGLWREGAPYSSRLIYDMGARDPQSPPVRYSEHALKPHSLCHMDAPAHIIPGGRTVDSYFEEGMLAPFFGRAVVVRLKPDRWTPVSGAPGQAVWRVTESELREAVRRASGSALPPEKLLLTADAVPEDARGAHHPDHALVLEKAAAEWLAAAPNFNAYGTSWKSTDFEPGSRERPIHETLFRRAVIYECLDLRRVPEGVYFLSAFPLPLEGASESPVCPVLFTKAELDAAARAL